MTDGITTIIIGSDHGGFLLKAAIIKKLSSQGIQIEDFGPQSEEPIDYPDIAKLVCQSVLKNSNAFGILCCGTGIGMSIVANRFPGIRATLVTDSVAAEMGRAHNNGNVLCLGARNHTIEESLHWVSIWLNTPFAEGRHHNRVAKFDTP